MRRFTQAWVGLCLCLVFLQLQAQPDIPALSQTDLPLFMEGDQELKTSEAARAIWESTRRQEILQAFADHVYGKAPTSGFERTYRYQSPEDVPDLEARRHRIWVDVETPKGKAGIRVTLFLPMSVGKPVPVFLGMHLFDTTRMHPTLGQPWQAPEPAKATPPKPISRFILERGYGFASIDARDVDPDEHDGFLNGVHALFRKEDASTHAPGDWGTLAAWAWGLSRALDALQTLDEVDHDRVIVIGHSRMGKAALWAGAVDPRFAMVISNNSGCGGAAISRRQVGETVQHINRVFPHWFCGRFHAYGDREATLPVDQHMLVALAAPRPVYVASAQEDNWADPHGEFLAAFYASEVYGYYGLKGIDADERPVLNRSIGDHVGYHLRSGRHDITSFDWEQYLVFADRHLKSPQ